MISVSYELDQGFIVPLGDLKEILQSLNKEEHQWAAVPVPHTIRNAEGDIRGYAAIGYTNPNPGNNYLAFLFPLLYTNMSAANPATEDTLLVCLHPESAFPLSRGLYPEDGEVKYDCMEDWDRFWEPIRDAVADRGRGAPGASHNLPA